MAIIGYDELLAPQTGTGDSGNFELKAKDLPASVCIPGIATSESALLEFTVDGTNRYTVSKNNVDQTIGVDANQDNPIRIDEPGVYNVAKGATSAACGVYLKKGIS